MKHCINCGELKELTEYYKHKQMGDGTLNKCKDCCKEQSKQRSRRLSNDPNWVEKERKRGREKYKRLNYKEKQKKFISKYPWKSNSKYKSLRKWFESRCGELDPLIELHHWSYKEENLRDVILLTRSKHKRLHALLEIEVDKRCYRVKETGYLLDTRDKHIRFMRHHNFLQWKFTGV